MSINQKTKRVFPGVYLIDPLEEDECGNLNIIEPPVNIPVEKREDQIWFSIGEWDFDSKSGILFTQDDRYEFKRSEKNPLIFSNKNVNGNSIVIYVNKDRRSGSFVVWCNDRTTTCLDKIINERRNL